MKLKLLAAFAFIALLSAPLVFLPGCDKEDKHEPACTLSNADLSYNKNIKSIIDQHCISCHAPGTGVVGAVGDFRSFDGLKTYLDNDKLLDRVVVKKDMPQGGGMSQGSRDSINCWIAAGYPQ